MGFITGEFGGCFLIMLGLYCTIRSGNGQTRQGKGKTILITRRGGMNNFVFAAETAKVSFLFTFEFFSFLCFHTCSDLALSRWSQ